MPRQTKSEIDAEIIDCAAGLFAHHGFARTSIQQIADALNYSKAGLLHYYPSKKALYAAVLDEYESNIRDRIAELLEVPVGIERDRQIVEAILAQCLRSPGMAEFGQHMAREPVDDRVVHLGIELLQALGVDLAAPQSERMARTFTAMGGASFAAKIAGRMGVEKEWRDHILTAAMRAFGHGTADKEDTPDS